MRLLLHTCCAPCSSAIIETLLKEGVQPVIYYCNPNIYPYEEYLIRKNECSRYAAECSLEIVDADYDHEAWLQNCALGREDQPERGSRCMECFKYRLLRAARYALDNGFDTLSTTLASSRWKSLDQINAAGRWSVEKALAEYSDAHPGQSAVPALEWWDRNWRKGGLQERRNQLIREKNFYNQLYCGCEFSVRNSK
ncbi:MAG: epoxyqueuosine reductase QueH [Bacteroidales bacterium]|nr:epoxyqueuosine reductase QueH [Bacteroidales bacterium]